MTSETALTTLDSVRTDFEKIRSSVQTLRTEKVSARIDRLRQLKKWIHSNRQVIHKAMQKDLGKPAAEVDMIEIFHVLSEIRLAEKNLRYWCAPRKIDAPFNMLGTRSSIRYEPRGACLVLSPWNYPFALAVGPLVSALAAGNAVILKPSEFTPNVSAIIASMVKEVFDPSVVSVCEGGPEVAKFLVTLPFDHIFFTGSPAIGKEVMKAAAENLVSVTLELGGKSPSIVTASANIREAAKRTVVAKFVNSGQTCVAPDYVLADEKIVDDLTRELVSQTRAHFSGGTDFEKSTSYCRIVSARHFDRLDELMQEAIHAGANVHLGGSNNIETRFFHPAILSGVPANSRLLDEEIFGPILPIVPYKHIDEAIAFVNARPKALALYIFSRDQKSIDKVLEQTSSGGACINDCGLHFLHSNLPFGGVNSSGIGKSHGYYGFLAFSNEKPVLRQKSGFTSIQPFYPPYSERSSRLVDWFLKWF